MDPLPIMSGIHTMFNNYGGNKVHELKTLRVNRP